MRRERALAAAVIAAAVVMRSTVFLVWEQSQFDADQAITGLMAKHLAQGRAFPVFFYGQSYMLAVEAWLAAPVFLVAGASVMTLRLPLLAINVAIALLLLRLFERDVGLRPWLAAVPTLFFALPAPGTTWHLLSANGGNVEPFAYVLLIWLTRNRPNWCGAVFALGFLQREFTLYGLVALLAIEAGRRTLFTREGIWRRLLMLRTATFVWLFVQWLKDFSSGAGPATTMGDVYRPRDNISALAERLCVDLQALPSGVRALATDHWPILFGTRVQPLADFGVDSTIAQGMPGGWLLLAAVAIAAAGGVAFRLATERRWRDEYDACAYLIVVALCSNAGYVIGRCGQITYLLLRYELLSLIGAAALGAWFLRAVPSRSAIRAWIVLTCALISISAVAHGRLLAEYLSNPPEGRKRTIANHLEARGVRYAVADYWLAYALTFLTDERVIVASGDLVRIQEYQRLVEENRDEAIRISREPCDMGRQIVAGIFFCPM